MRRDQPTQVAARRMTAFLVAALAVSHVELAWADQTDRLSAQESIVIGGSVTKSTINNTINKQDPAVLAAMAKTFADQIAATTEARAQAEARVADLASKLGFTTSAVTAFFKILGEQKVPEEKVPVRLIEIATHFGENSYRPSSAGARRSTSGRTGAASESGVRFRSAGRSGFTAWSGLRT